MNKLLILTTIFILTGCKDDAVILEKQNKFTAEWEDIGIFYNLAETYDTCAEIKNYLESAYTSEYFRCRPE